MHLIVYSKNENQGYLAPQGVEQLRSSLAREIFAQDLLSVYQEQTAYRDELRTLGKTQLTSIVESIRTGNYSNPALEEKLRALADQLAETAGKKVYGYLKAEVKATVDSVVEELASDPRITTLYDLWYQQREEMIRTYTEELTQRIPLWQNEEFKSIRNAVIQNALNIAKSQEPLDIPENSDLPDIDPSPEEVETFVTPSDSGASPMWPLYFRAKAMLDQNGTECNPGQAVELLTQAAKLGCGVAKYRIGKLLLRGEDVPQDVDEACRWLEESIAEDNNPFSEYLLGKAFLKGEPTEQDIARGEELLRRSAMQNNRYAYYTLGKALLDGDPVPQNITEGITFLKQSADLRFSNAEYIYGKLLYKGEVIPPDIAGAIDYLERASAAQNPYAAYLAGKIRLAKGPYNDVSRAISHFQIAARAGNDYAEYQLGKLYFYGQEVPEDSEKGMEYLRASADHGNFYAQQLLLRIHSGQVFSAAMGSLRLLQNLSQLLQEKIEGEHKFRIRNIDRKVNQKIQEKKEAHGLKQG